jgi:hypothetical protein
MKKETLSTSEKEIPKTVLGLEEKYKEEAKTAEPTKEPLNPENIKSVTIHPKRKNIGWINYCTRIIRPFKNSY